MANKKKKGFGYSESEEERLQRESDEAMSEAMSERTLQLIAEGIDPKVASYLATHSVAIESILQVLDSMPDADED